MREGNTATVRAVQAGLSDGFNMQASRSVVKDFKPLSGDGPASDKNLSTVRDLLTFIRDYHREATQATKPPKPLAV